MGNTQQPSFWEDVWGGIVKGVGYLALIILGVAAKLAMESRRHELSRRQKVIKIILSVFSGALASFTCEYYNVDRMLSSVIVPIATLLGEAALDYLIKNWPYLLRSVIGGGVPKSPKKN